MNACRCGSYAINHKLHGRDGSDPELCDVCYWRKRATNNNDTEIDKTIKSETHCPMCGVPCDIGGDDKEGTHYYIPRPGVYEKCAKCKHFDVKNKLYTFECMECKQYYGDLFEPRVKK